MEDEADDQRPHRRLDLPADHHPAGGIQRSGDAEPERRLHLRRCAAQVGGLGIAPGANIGDGYAVFEATHGTAPKYADKDVINPGSVMLSGVMMFDFLGWNEAARLIEERDGADHPAEEGDLRLRAHDGRRDQGEDQRVRRSA